MYYFKVIQKSQNCRRNSLFSKNSDDWLLIDDVTIWREPPYWIKIIMWLGDPWVESVTLEKILEEERIDDGVSLL